MMAPMTQPKFNVYQDIQSQNDFSIVELNAMGYSGDHLRAQVNRGERQDKLVPVTVTQTLVHQEAIAMASTAGGCFL
jgi:hypothetical protein